MLETGKSKNFMIFLNYKDCPYCEIRPSHAGFKYLKTKRQYKNKESFKKGCMVRGRNEPCNIKYLRSIFKENLFFRQVLEVVSGILNKPEEEIAEIAYTNTLKMFSLI